MRKWCSIEAIPTLTRQRVLDANDLLDAMDEAEEVARERAKQKAQQARDR